MVFTNHVVLFNNGVVIVGTEKVPNNFQRQARVANNESFSTGVSVVPVMYCVVNSLNLDWNGFSNDASILSVICIVYLTR